MCLCQVSSSHHNIWPFNINIINAELETQTSNIIALKLTYWKSLPALSLIQVAVSILDRMTNSNEVSKYFSTADQSSSTPGSTAQSSTGATASPGPNQTPVVIGSIPTTGKWPSFLNGWLGKMCHHGIFPWFCNINPQSLHKWWQYFCLQ